MIKWNGKDTQKIWNRDVEAGNMKELFNKLLEMNIISDEELHLNLLEISKEYSELTDKIDELNELQDPQKFDELDVLIQKQLNMRHDVPAAMNDSDLKFLIQSCDSQAFYQSFQETENNIDLKKIEELLNSDISAYSIEKETGVSRTAISNYRTGKMSIGNMTVDTAKKLIDFIENGK